MLVGHVLVGVASVPIPAAYSCPRCALACRIAQEFDLIALDVTLQDHSPSTEEGTQSPSGDVVVPLTLVIGNALGHCCGDFDLYTNTPVSFEKVLCP